MGKAISSTIFLVLIGAVIFGGKIFVLDPMQADKALQDAKKDLQKLVDDNEYKKAYDVCDEFEKQYPQQKSFCDARRFQVLVEWAKYEDDQSTIVKRRWSKAEGKKKDKLDKKVKAHAKKCIKLLKRAEKFDDLTRIELLWLSNSYGELGMKDEMKATNARRNKLKE